MTEASVSTLNPSPSKIYKLDLSSENADNFCSGHICQRVWTLELLGNEQTSAHALISNWTRTLCADHWLELEHYGGTWNPCFSPDQTDFTLHQKEPVFLRIKYRLNAVFEGVIYLWTKGLSLLNQHQPENASKIVEHLVSGLYHNLLLLHLRMCL